MASNQLRIEARRIKSARSKAAHGYAKGKVYKGKRLRRMGVGRLRIRA